jgi:DNA end-binding protein Ku
MESIDPVYYDKTYYLAPDKGASKPYALLTEALKETKRCAVGRWASRGKAYIVALRPVDGILAMQQLRFATEVRPAAEVEVPRTEVKPAELKLAQQLIDSQQADMFDPSTYVDEVRGRVEAAIQKKVEGQEISISEAPVPSTGKVIDLMEALRASLEKTEAARASTSKLGARKSGKRVEEPRPAAKRADEPKAAPARKSAKR